MRKDELDRRCAEMKARILAQRAGGGQASAAAPVNAHQCRQSTAPAVEPAPGISYAIERPHPLIVSTRRILKSKTPFGPLLHLGSFDSLDISVGRDAVDRSLWFMDHLIKRCEAAGMKIFVAPKDRIASTVQVDGESLPVRIKEKTTRVEKDPSPEEKRRREIHPKEHWRHGYDYVPSGSVYFEIVGSYGPRKRWLIKSTDAIGNIIEGLLATAAEEKKNREETAARERAWRENERRRYEEQQRRADEEKRIEALRREAADWAENARITSYLNAVEEYIRSQGGDCGPETAVGKWIQWARAYAKKLDPLSRIVFVGKHEVGPTEASSGP